MSDTAPPTDAPATDLASETDATDYKAEAEKWKELARKHEDRAKANSAAAKELEQVRQQSMSDTEKAVATARLEGRTEAMREAATRLVDAEVRTCAAGRPVDVEALLEGLDRARFIGADGEPDSKAIAAWVDRVAPKAEETKPGFPEMGQGVRTSSTTALNGDPLLRDLEATLGIRRR